MTLNLGSTKSSLESGRLRKRSFLRAAESWPNLQSTWRRKKLQGKKFQTEILNINFLFLKRSKNLHHVPYLAIKNLLFRTALHILKLFIDFLKWLVLFRETKFLVRSPDLSESQYFNFCVLSPWNPKKEYDRCRSRPTFWRKILWFAQGWSVNFYASMWKWKS